MKLDVKFSESNQSFNPLTDENNQSFGTDFGEIQTIHGKDGEDGKSAYQIAVDNGFKGSETEWLESLHGKDGKDGSDGKAGYTPVKNVDYFDGKDGYSPQKTVDYWTDEDKEEIVEEVVSIIPSVDLPYATEVYADTQVSTHNVSNSAHNDMRLLISDLSVRLNALANSDDTTLDQMAEVVEYIKDNRELIEQVTTGKISVSDIVNDLTTNVSDRPLSAAQGVALKVLIDSIVIPEVPTNVSAFNNDAGYLTKHQDLSEYAKLSDIPTFETEEWTFELEDGSTVTKAVVIK